MNIIPEENEEAGNPVFDLEKEHEAELRPLILELCQKAEKIGVPVFVTVCYKTDSGGSWFASSVRVRDDFVPHEFKLMRAIVEGQLKLLTTIPVKEE